MAQWIKQSTASTVKLGPFLDDTDGKTAETGLTISQADIRISKNGGAFAQSNNTAGATHNENGYYSVPLDTTDTNTLGTFRVAVSKSGALPVWQDYMVVPANVWDSMFGASTLNVNVATLSSAAVDSILDDPVEGSYTMRQLLRLMASALFGKASGGGTATITFRDLGDSKDRITATVTSNGNRTTVVLDGS
jgi:hypothetical protein